MSFPFNDEAINNEQLLDDSDNSNKQSDIVDDSPKNLNVCSKNERNFNIIEQTQKYNQLEANKRLVIDKTKGKRKKKSRAKKIEVIPKSIIDEDPELTSSIEYSHSKIDVLGKVKTIFSKGFLFNTILTLFYQTPIITLIYYPFAFSLCGCIVGVAFLLLIALNAYFSSFLMLRVKHATGTKSFREFIHNYLGENFSILYNIIYFLYCFGLTIIYVFTYAEIMNNLSFIENHNFHNTITKAIILIGGIIFIGIPSVFILKGLLFKVMKIANIILIIISIIILTILYNVHSSCIQNDLSQFVYIDINQNYALAFAIIMLSMSEHPFLYKQMNELQLFTVKRAKRMLTSTALILLIFYFCFGLLGLKVNQFSTNKDNESNIIHLANIIYNSNAKSGFIFFCLEFINICIALISLYNASHSIYDFYYSMQLFIEAELETESNKGSWKDKKSKMHNKWKYPELWSIVTLIIVGFVVFFFNKSISVALVLSGGICAAFLCYVLPCFGFICVFNQEKKMFIFFVYFVIGVLGITGVVITVVELYEIIFHIYKEV